MENTTMTRTFWLVFVVLALAACAAAYGEEDALARDLARISPSKGWKCAGDVKTYDRSNLYELIDGEAEVYFPYGFKRALAVSYASTARPQDGIAAEIYEMGSLLDAFGVYSNYRDPASKPASLGAEGFASGTQAMFYKDRFFVKVRTRGTSDQNQAAPIPCARTISRILPGGTTRPEELDLLDIQALVPQTQQYFAQSVLGYDFFSTGLTAEAFLSSLQIKVFVIIEVTSKTARQALERYEAFLTSSNAHPHWQELPSGKVMAVDDPLYKGVLVKQIGNMIIGVAKLPDPEQGLPVLGQLQSIVARKVNQSVLPDKPKAPARPAQEQK
jgi:hypothetical protein